jgi:hypothetical protein
MSLGSSTSSSSSSTFQSIQGIDEYTSSSSNKMSLPYFFILILLVVFFWFVTKKYHGLDIMTKIRNLFSKNPELDIHVEKTLTQTAIPEIRLTKQVFNIPENDYIYQDAKALCSAYGARLATYQEVEDSYKAGGEWCNYGWSDGQMALFPTQKKTFEQLQKIEGHEHDCGRPGVNGGYIANPNIKYGVNCYGYKPRMTPQEEDIMATKPIYPKTQKDIAMENRVNYWKDKLSEVLVSPFNHNSWSRL